MTYGQSALGARGMGVAMAVAASLAVPVQAQDASAPASTSGFRLPPQEDGRSPGVQGPSDNGLPPRSANEPRPQPSAPTPTPAPITAVPPVTTPTTKNGGGRPAPQPEAGNGRASNRAATTSEQRGTSSNRQVGTTEDVGTPPLPTDTTPSASAPTSAAPATTDPVPAPTSEAAAAVEGASDGGTPLWAWLLAALAALAAGIWYWRRQARTAVAIDSVAHAPEPAASPQPKPKGIAEPEARPSSAATSPTPVPAPAAPAPAAPTPAAPTPAAPVAPVRLPAEPRRASSLVTRPAAERRAELALTFKVDGILITADNVVVRFDLDLENHGDAEAVGVLVRIALQQGSAMPESVLARFFDGAGGSVLRDGLTVAPHGRDRISTEIMLPRQHVEPLNIGGKPVLIPVMAIDVTYHWDGDGEAFGQAAGSYVLGREAADGAGNKLAPLPLTSANHVVDRPGSRSTAVRRQQ